MQVISTENARHYQWGESCDGWHLLASQNLSIIQERVPPGGSELRHYHETAEQFFFVLAGEVTLEVEAQSFVLQAQQGMHVPAGVSHQLSNQGDIDCLFIVTSTPPSHGDRVQS